MSPSSSPWGWSELELSGFGISTELPSGWEGRISKREEAPAPAPTGPSAPSAALERTFPVVHLANFALPETRGDFGAGAVELMGPQNLLVVLFEYGEESLGAPLFAQQGLPRVLTPDLFAPNQLQRGIEGQAGYQVFFTEGDRPFCLYVVLGAQTMARRLVPQANQVLTATTITPR